MTGKKKLHCVELLSNKTKSIVKKPEIERRNPKQLKLSNNVAKSICVELCEESGRLRWAQSDIEKGSFMHTKLCGAVKDPVYAKSSVAHGKPKREILKEDGVGPSLASDLKEDELPRLAGLVTTGDESKQARRCGSAEKPKYAQSETNNNEFSLAAPAKNKDALNLPKLCANMKGVRLVESVIIEGALGREAHLDGRMLPR